MSRPVVAWATTLLVDGKPVDGLGAPIEVADPSTGELLCAVRAASAAQCDASVAAARHAFDGGPWASPEERARLLVRLADLIEAHREELTATVVYEIGTPIAYARMHIDAPILLLRDYAELAVRDWTDALGRHDGPPAASESRVTYHPAGVVAAITAYNYPLMLAAGKIGAALAAGCTTVLLPSPQTPLSTLALAELIAEAGFPAGVVNVVVGGADIARHLTEHAGVDKVTFTGSVEVGRMVMQQAAGSVKGVVLELGGKSPALVLPSADLRRAATLIHHRYTRNAGQGCMSPTRILVQREQVDEFVDLTRLAYTKLPVGDPWDPKTMVGPVISERHRARVEGFVESAVAAGGRVVAGGGRPAQGAGWFVNPTMVAGVSNDERVSREEIFGPVAVLLAYDSVDEAVAIGNDSELGLAAYVWGDLDEAMSLAPRLRAGSVFINGGGGLRPEAPLGGYKQSGIGRECGELGVREFLEPQHVQWLLP